MGGKIPESAFYHDRLALNRLNQLGIYTIDGVYLERIPVIHSSQVHIQDTFKVLTTL